MQKTNKKIKRIDNLENEVKEQEKELKALKEAFEKNNMNALNNLPMQGLPKTSRLSAKAPKRLTSKGKDRIEEIRRWKEVEDLNKIQQSLLKQVKGRKKIEPIDKRILTANRRFMNIDKDDLFAINLNKECDRILGIENSKQSLPNRTMATGFRKNSERIIRNTSNKKDRKSFGKNNLAYPLSAANRIHKMRERKIEKFLSDKVKDEEYLELLDDEIKNFYLEKTKEIFELLREINLSRYIDGFLREGYDIFEEFIDLPNDFFDKMEKPFLNKEQQEKLYNKLTLVKNKNNTIIEKNNKNKTIDNNKINENKYNNKYNKTENNVNGINIKSKIEQKLNLNKKDINKNKNLNNMNKNLNENDNDKKNFKKNNKNNNKNTSNETNNGKELNDMSPMITKEELFYTNIDIEELERQRTEEFKKAVEEWRNNSMSLPSNEPINKINQESNAPVNNSSLLVNSPDEIICCWNCFKPLKKENSIQKDYENKLDKSILFKEKHFCNLKCVTDYEKKKKTKYVCFQCNKTFDLYRGFVVYEGEKYCSTNCKNKYIEIETILIKRSKKHKKEKKSMVEKNKENKNEKTNNNVNNDEDYYEGDDYDPMNDF